MAEAASRSQDHSMRIPGMQEQTDRQTDRQTDTIVAFCSFQSVYTMHTHHTLLLRTYFLSLLTDRILQETTDCQLTDNIGNLCCNLCCMYICAILHKPVSSNNKYVQHNVHLHTNVYTTLSLRTSLPHTHRELL